MNFKLYLLFIFSLFIITEGFAQPVAAGDIAFLGFNSDNNDQFSIILTNYIEDGSIIYFTDAGWSGSGFYGTEGHMQWSLPAGGLPTGTIVTFTGAGAGGFTVFGTGAMEAGATVTSGTLAATASTSPVAFNTSGDQIIAYIGSMASPTFIACVNFNGAWSYGTSTQTQIPTGLTAGTNCVLLNNHDNGIIDCSLLPDPATPADYNNASYWVYNDVTRYSLPPAGEPCDLVLPIELSEFYATPENDLIILNWLTGSEINTDVFVIEKSTDGFNFYMIGFVEAAGFSNAPLHYVFMDDALSERNNYYRLKLMDLDGSVTYSETISAINENNQIQFSLYPNPNAGTFSIQLNAISPIHEFAAVVVYNMTGEIVYNEMVEIENKKINCSMDLKNIITGDMCFVKVTIGAVEYCTSMVMTN